MNAKNDPRRAIPSMSELLESAEAGALIARHARGPVLGALRAAGDELRKSGTAADVRAMVDAARTKLEADELDRLRPVVNATGILLHTGLGRAVLPKEAALGLAQMDRCCNLQIDLAGGKRGKRNFLCERLICELTGAEAALIVNNNAAATLLILAALCNGREAVVSRGELIEIGGSYRLPDCVTASGAVMREVGTTNKTHLRDYEGAIAENTGALLRVNPSNYRVIGFSQRVALDDLAALAKKRGVLLIDDLGCGALVDLSAYGLPRESLVQDSLAAGADVVCFSGDKMIGGPQAGIVAGRKELIDRIRKHPLTRMLRVGKLTDMALEQTLRLFREPERLPERHPLFRMLAKKLPDLRAAAEKLAAAIGAGASVEEGSSEMGGGALPGVELPTALVALRSDKTSAAEIAKRLRCRDVPVIARIQDDRVVLDMRTLLPGEDEIVVAAVKEVLNG
ncbi:MAG: L-seryl-tRNA(Sec) selenium transferase [Opitutae bacterium]|nr:L-seryl-tRNA(Sec) selenium transferase [Opitutae bacterium]